MPAESRQRETLFAVMRLGPQAIPDTELTPEFPVVDGLKKWLDLCLLEFMRTKHALQTCSLHFCRCAGS